jgi:uncharacterized protein YjbJ (UPF0337 family)
MNWEHIEHNWTAFQGFALTMWGELTEDDLCRIEGNQLQLIGRIQERYSIARAEAERQVIEWASNCRNIQPIRGTPLLSARSSFKTKI